MDTNFSKEVISLNSDLKSTKRNTPSNCRNDGLMDLINIYATKEYIDNSINTINDIGGINWGDIIDRPSANPDAIDTATEPDIQGEKENNIVEVKNYTIIDNDEN